MSGRFTKQWPDELRRAVERRGLDEHVKAPQIAREAAAGQLRREIAGEKLQPYPIPVTTVRAILEQERKRRQDLHLEAAAITDPEAAQREMIRLLLAETKAELIRAATAFRGGKGHTRKSNWPELQAMAKTVEAVGRATAAMEKRERSNTTASESADAPSFLQGLAGEKGRPSPVPPHTEATTQASEPEAA